MSRYEQIMQTLLDAAPKEDAGPCPSPEALVAFQEDRLDGLQRGVILEYMRRCTNCTDNVLILRSVDRGDYDSPRDSDKVRLVRGLRATIRALELVGHRDRRRL